MHLLAFKLVVTPLLILVATLSMRRWNATIGGILVALPLTSAPVSVFLALEYGNEFAALATNGTLNAAMAQLAFGCAFSRLARHGWLPGLAGAALAFITTALLLRPLALSNLTLFASVCVAVAIALRYLPAPQDQHAPGKAPSWDIALRMLLVAVLTAGITLLAPSIGPSASGVVAAFPWTVAVLCIFTHRTAGVPAAQRMLRGMVLGVPSFAFFFLILAEALPRFSLPTCYLLASVGTLLLQGVVMLMMRRASR